MPTDLEAAWDELHAANETLRWFIGPTSIEERKAVPWSLYAFDPRERPNVGQSLARVDRDCTD